MDKMKMSRSMETAKMVKIAMLGTIGALLMFIQFPLPFAPPFMTVDVGDLPVLISGFLLGPVAGVITAFIKILIRFFMKGSDTGGVGELSNFIIASTFVVVSSVIYLKKNSKKYAIIGIIAGVCAMTAVATISNYFVIFPLFGIDLVKFAKSFSAVNPFVKTPITFLIYAIVPFNLFKGFLTGIITMLLYKPLGKVIKRS